MDCLYYFWQFEACFHIQCVPTNRINTNRQVTGLSVIAKSGTGGGSGTLCTLHPSATRFESRLSKTFTNWHYICHWVVAQMYFCRFGLVKTKKIDAYFLFTTISFLKDLLWIPTFCEVTSSCWMTFCPTTPSQTTLWPWNCDLPLQRAWKG